MLVTVNPPRESDPILDVTRYGPWALIAGGSEGVGAAFADLLASAGFNLILIARSASTLDDVATLCRGRGVEVRTVAADLTDRASIADIVEATKDLEVGLLICNAGATVEIADFLDGDLETFQGVVELNITACLALVHHYGGRMRERRRGGIILVGSMVSYLGSPKNAAYSGAKAFSRIFGESLWLELLDYDVHVLHLVLGLTRTPAMARLGLDFTRPGVVVAEPYDVAREGLAHLPVGPVWVAAGLGPEAARRSGPDRAALALQASRRAP